MNLKPQIILIIVLFFCPILLFGQDVGIISGKIKSENKLEISFGTVHIKELKKTYYSNDKGFYQTEKLPYGNYTIIIYSSGYHQVAQKIELNQPKLSLNFQLKKLNIDLETFKVEATNKQVGVMRKMNPIEGVLISQGKKTEVISLAEMNTNKSVSIGRQIYSRIPGLNIWESDGAGIQLGIGGRGLNPKRTVNFNTRQNGYDISADALGYPETYYTPPSEAVEEIQIIRGAASLQFGTQFGGLLNFVTKTGVKDKTLQATYRGTIGSFGLVNNFVSLGGSKNTWDYYGYFQHKKGDDWRPNSEFEVFAGSINFRKYINEKLSVKIELTKMNYLNQQPGGLTDLQFIANPDTSFRERNWFGVDWNLGAATIDYEFNSLTKINSRFFGLSASRKALGFLGQINRIDFGEDRDLIEGKFKNFGNETRLLHIYDVKKNPWALLVGFRLYKGLNISKQGLADNDSDADFNFLNPDNLEDSDFRFPSTNIAFFTENIFNLSKRLSITPGVRFEYIKTEAIGSIRNSVKDLAGNIIFDTTIVDVRINKRSFVIGGIGVNYKFSDTLEIYANFSQNYRSINFTDMQISNPNFKIDSDLKDETGYNADLGVKGFIGNKLNYDISVFALFYNNRIGTTVKTDPKLFSTFQFRTNIAKSITTGIEAVVEIDLWKVLISDTSKISFSVFTNISFLDAHYISSEEPAFDGKSVEFVSPFTLKTGATFAYKKFALTYQYSYTQQHFSDATNAVSQANAANGIVPTYFVMDLSLRYTYKKIGIETGVNNITDNIYFTRRATAYPGPGIIPSPPRSYYFTLQIQI